MSSPNQPCGCNDLTMEGAVDLAIPPLEEFEQSLQVLSSSSPTAGAELNELELACLEADPASLDELSRQTPDDGSQLSDLIRLLKRYPGLKISLSF
ncbi:MAG: hypothetical protein L0211_01145 [Planctomycetaceae bacterium]|nr:hypothetical protein [Planctomycetaceae bacterium]